MLYLIACHVPMQGRILKVIIRIQKYDFLSKRDDILSYKIILNSYLVCIYSDHRFMHNKDLYSWKDKHILIVEDDESSTVLLREILKKTGAAMLFSDSGEEALDMVRKHPEIDLVLMDIHLPHKDGITTTNEIRELRKDIIVIAQSAYLLTAEQQQASLTKFDDFITKPLNQYLLLAKIDKYLS